MCVCVFGMLNPSLSRDSSPHLQIPFFPRGHTPIPPANHFPVTTSSGRPSSCHVHPAHPLLGVPHGCQHPALAPPRTEFPFPTFGICPVNVFASFFRLGVNSAFQQKFKNPGSSSGRGKNTNDNNVNNDHEPPLLTSRFHFARLEIHTRGNTPPFFFWRTPFSPYFSAGAGLMVSFRVVVGRRGDEKNARRRL